MKLRQWRERATETAEVLKTTQVDLTLQSALQYAAQEEMDAQSTNTTDLQELLAANGAELAPLFTGMMRRPTS